MLSAIKSPIFLGEPIQLRFKKPDSYNEYLIEAETEQTKLDLTLKYSEESIDKDNYLIKILWDIPSDIVHEEAFDIVVTLKHKNLHNSKSILELEKLFSMAIYEKDKLEVKIKVIPFVKVYGDTNKIYIEALQNFDWVENGISFSKGDVFTSKSISKEISMLVQLEDDCKFKLRLWVMDFTSRYKSNQMVNLSCNLKSLKFSSKKITIGLNLLGAAKKNSLFTLEFKLINFTETIQSYKIEQLITESELNYVGETSKSTTYVHTCTCYNPVEVLNSTDISGSLIKLHPSALRVKIVLKPGECSIVQLQAVSFVEYLHKLVAVRLRDTMAGVLEDVPVNFYIPVESS
eukprot:NODE_57_length_28844_cov_0.352687.p9 type:complete len:346 gc:universal NODE_57_length_28844_cov_0.352687:3921-2884(-)